MKITLLLTIFATLLRAAEPPLVHLGRDGKLVYVPHANVGETNKDNVIPDFSHCGYKGGGVRIPDVPVKIVIEPKEGPDRVRIQEAIDKVSKMPLDENGFRGAVLIKAGTYITSEGGGRGLRINAGGVVVRGEGQGLKGTLLKVTVPGRHSSFTVSPPKGSEPEFTESPVSRITDDYVGSGATTFSVENARGFAVGDTIRVYFTPNQTWLDETYANTYMGGGDKDWTTERYTIPFERRITLVAGNTLTIDSPIVCPMQKKYGGGEVRKLTLSKGARLVNVGIENLSVTCPEDVGAKNRINDAIVFNHVTNGWISGVTVTHQYDSAVRLDRSRFITVQDCASLKPVGHKRGGYRYTYYIGPGSNHVLMQRCYAYDGRHDFVTYAYSPGPNVFLDCYATKGGTQGPHQRWSSGVLFDNIIANAGLAISEHRGGSGSGHSWTGVTDVGWNVTASSIICNAPKGFQNYAIGCVGEERKGSYVNYDREGVYRGYYASHGEHVRPRSLYLYQLYERLGPRAVYNITTEDQRKPEGPVHFYPRQPEFASKVVHIFDEPVEVEITSNIEDATIRYTTDGSEPTLDSALYEPPLMIDKPLTIKAIALDGDFRSSPVAAATVRDALEEVKPEILPEVSHIFDQPVAVGISYPFDSAVLRYTLDGSDPAPDSPRYTGPLLIDQPRTVKAIALDGNSKTGPVGVGKVWNAFRPSTPGFVTPGLYCRYYEGKWPRGKILPDFGSLEPKNASVEEVVALPDYRSKKFYALLFTGYVRAPRDGVYTFYIEANDGANLLIGDRRILDHEKDKHEATVGLYAGLHPIEVQFFQKRYAEGLKVWWSGPGFEKTPLPASVLSHVKE